MAANHPHRVPRAEWKGRLTADDLIAWARDEMAAYKVQRLVEFVDALQKSGTGKVMWRALHEAEAAKTDAASEA